ncbi:AMP-binding enzyme [uncultured archaeon]|nr:AMP-binding enzyme [uncultured archaeon]
MADMLDAKRRLLNHFGIPSSENGFWESVPLHTKEDIRAAPGPRDFAMVSSTSGSTGAPSYVFYSQDAYHAFIGRAVRQIKAAGAGKSDIALNLFAYNYIGNFCERACIKAGVPVVPLGFQNTCPKEKTLEAIELIRPTLWLSIPSYALKLLEELGPAQADCVPRSIVVTGERLLESYSKRFNDIGISVSNIFGMTECPFIGISKKEDFRTFRVTGSDIFLETLDTEKGTELVVTDLKNFSTPVIRYKTGDVVTRVKYNEDGSVREFHLESREDDRIKINSELFSKSSIEDAISKYSEDFVLRVQTKDYADFIELTLPEKCRPEKNALLQDLSHFRSEKALVFAGRVDVPRTSSGKLKRIIDLRK